MPFVNAPSGVIYVLSCMSFRRMSRVCRSWRQVASEPILWREVNLSAMSIECPRSATDSTIEKLACTRLKAVKDLNLDGWSELTDTGLKVKN